MAILKNVPCGGVLLDDTIFAVVDNIITLVGKEKEDIVSTVTMCSLEFNGDYFNIIGTPYQFVLTSAARDTETETEFDITAFTANCGGLTLDAEYFEIGDDGAVTGDMDKILGKKDDGGDDGDDETENNADEPTE